MNESAETQGSAERQIDEANRMAQALVAIGQRLNSLNAQMDSAFNCTREAHRLAAELEAENYERINDIIAEDSDCIEDFLYDYREALAEEWADDPPAALRDAISAEVRSEIADAVESASSCFQSTMSDHVSDLQSTLDSELESSAENLVSNIREACY